MTVADWVVPRYAIIPTRGRPDDLRRCVESIVDQVDHILIIDNNDGGDHSTWSMLERFDRRPLNVTVRRIAEQPPNLSRLWNEGLEYVYHIFSRDWFLNEPGNRDVAILNDDAIASPGWFAHLSGVMRGYGAAAGSSHPFEAAGDRLWGPDAEPSIYTRVTGWAFMLRGELGFRFDEQFQWWCGDDDMSVWARNNGGLVHIGGFPVQNTHANQSTVGELAEIAAADMQRFVNKHGRRPW